MARNQLMLEPRRREQEAALHEHYHDEVSRSAICLTGRIPG
jgi:hypothetical protein